MPTPQFGDPTPSYLPKPPTTNLNNFSFPGDLTANGRNFYCQIQFVDYSFFSGSGSYTSISGGVTLPIPKKLTDSTSVIWEEFSLTSAVGAMGQAAGGLASALGGKRGQIVSTAISAAGAAYQGSSSGVGGALGGLAQNPMMVMTFKSPNFKSFSFSWSFAANNPQESRTIADIVNYFKFNMLPGAGGSTNPYFTYPSIALIKLFPDDAFTFKLKPCAVESVSVDFTGAGSPSFFKGTGAPTVVNLSVNFKEIELWTKGNYGTTTTNWLS